MKSLMLYFIAGMLFVGFGYHHCSQSGNNYNSFQYALNIVIWPVPLVVFMMVPKDCK